MSRNIFNNGTDVSINDIHDEALVQHFKDGIGNRVFLLIPNFPFMLIGMIKDVIDDHVEINVETSTQAVFENRLWQVHIHAIEVFFIEREGGPQIPVLRN
ncbi:hypothetical protein CV093_15565 [Oceanobacillus sp. 143]|uniref:DUF2642 domain-containing protein n=1 Tax=Oceanobacillus zhaokaii TaxID=2052660 RepID=A0A345PJB2_9BACI|nr:hypothetical protein [Oceanobacillus zhaokaii]AXI10092.1 hypothetical protein CUC15_14650 [Oceanobacillus zhaokaii]QGS69223.1 hypothetical protein CV093_15565 [Oceanobacillus sp. 143]